MKYKLVICISLLASVVSACGSAPQGNLMRDDQIDASKPAPPGNLMRDDRIDASKPVKSRPIPSTRIPLKTALRDDDNKNQFQEALNHAKIATNLAKSAKTETELKAVVNQWNKAIELMKTVPKSDQNYPISQQKIVEYEKSLTEVRNKIKM